MGWCCTTTSISTSKQSPLLHTQFTTNSTSKAHNSITQPNRTSSIVTIHQPSSPLPHHAFADRPIPPGSLQTAGLPNSPQRFGNSTVSRAYHKLPLSQHHHPIPYQTPLPRQSHATALATSARQRGTDEHNPRGPAKEKKERVRSISPWLQKWVSFRDDS